MNDSRLTIIVYSVNNICELLSLEFPFKAKPTILESTSGIATDFYKGSPGKGEKGVVRSSPPRFTESAADMLRKSRADLNIRLQMEDMEPVHVVIPAAA